MGLFKKKDSDPITERSRQLTAQIADLESKIKKLNGQAEPEAGPRLRSTVYPNTPPRPAAPAEPVFEPVDQNRLKAPSEPSTTAQHFNELGARKYDLPALLRRFKNHFHSPTASNPKLINYLAAGNIQGLRPLRYEKRVARNRFIALTILFVLVLFGIFYFLVRRH